MTTKDEWLRKAHEAHGRGDSAAEAAALDALIRADRTNIAALIAMAELKRRLNDERAASSFYRLALATAAQARDVHPALHPSLQRAEQYLSDVDNVLADHLFSRLRAAGLDQRTATPRVAEALRLLSGEQPLYQQQPNMFYFPGLAQRAFFDRS